LSLDRVGPSLGVGAFTTAAPAFFAAAVIGGSLSVASVTSSLHSVITVVLAAVLLRERVLPVQRAGTVLAVAGVLLLSASS
jgi:drug/metabolite transporter (DMT)-like permease